MSADRAQGDGIEQANHVTSTDATRAVIEKYYAALAAGDFETALSLVHPDLRLEEPGYLPYGGRHVGKDALVKVFKHVGRWVDAKTMSIRTLIVDDIHAVAIMDAAVRVSGAPVLAAEHWSVEDGLIRSGQIYFFDPRPITQL